MALSDEEFGRLTRQKKTVSAQVQTIKSKIIEIGELLSEVGAGLQKPDHFSYWHSSYDGSMARPEAKLAHDFPSLTKIIDESAQLLAELLVRKQELSNIEFQLDHS